MQDLRGHPTVIVKEAGSGARGDSDKCDDDSTDHMCNGRQKVLADGSS